MDSLCRVFSEHAYSEFKLKEFESLYKDYRFDEVVDVKKSKRKGKQWNYFVVCLNPNISIKVDDDERKKAEFCRVLAINFYNSIFERDDLEKDTEAMAITIYEWSRFTTERGREGFYDHDSGSSPKSCKDAYMPSFLNVWSHA